VANAFLYLKVNDTLTLVNAYQRPILVRTGAESD
jgi:hypothetical protein